MKERRILIGLLCKRLLFQKSFWLCLVLIPLCSLLATGLEKTSETSILVALYSEDQELWRESFIQDRGIYDFYFCETREQLKRDVVTGRAECGYILTEDLQKRFEEGDWFWAVEVYESADSMLTKVINETVFERIFVEVSSSWYEGFIAEQSEFADVPLEETLQLVRETLLAERSAGTFFHIQFEYIQSDQVQGAKETTTSKEQPSLFPVRGMVATGIYLSGLLGAMTVLHDKEKKYFIGKPKLFIRLTQIALPVFFSLVIGNMTLLLTGQSTGILSETPRIVVYGLIVIGYCILLSVIVRHEKLLAGLIPFFVLGSMVFTPVWIDLSSLGPVFKLLGKCFPAAYYLNEVIELFK